MLEGAQDAQDPLVGRVLMGRYRLTRVLGEGGMGKVYLAEQKLGTAVRKVAVKTLRAELSQDPQLVGRFHRECETVVQLHHPNTVQFYDFGEMEGSILFIVMEYIEGMDLAERLEQGPLPVPLVDKILIQICGSLQEAHQNGIVHRDLKPDNVLLTQRGGQADFVKVLDFGIAKNNQTEQESRTQLTMQGMILGTPPYMSPEQFGSDPLDARSDVYSLGLMTYEMLTGRLPFEAKTPWEWATRHLTESPLDIQSLEPGRVLPPARRDAVMRALSKNRDHRQASVMEFLQEFTGINDTQVAWTVATSGPFDAVARTSSLAPVPSTHGDPESPIVLPKRGFRGLMFAAMTVLVGGVFGGFYWFAGQEAGQARGAATAVSVTDPGLGKRPVPAAPVAQEEPPSPAQTPVEAPKPEEELAVAEDPESVTAVVEDEPAPRAKTASVKRGRPKPSSSPRPESPVQSPAPVASGPTEAQLAQAGSLVAGARADMNAQSLEAAAKKLQSARALVGASHAGVQAATQELATLGGRSVGNLLMRGRCEEAQALYKALRSASAHGPAGSNFAGDWCPKP
jgi:eukaryotic-like serine/threonine-protein kinase